MIIPSSPPRGPSPFDNHLSKWPRYLTLIKTSQILFQFIKKQASGEVSGLVDVLYL